MNFHRPQAAQGIEDGNDGHAYVSKDGAPHIGDTYGGQSQHQKLDAQCKDNVLLDDTTGTPGNGYLPMSWTLADLTMASAASMAASAPKAPMATPTSARASTGASLIPSPTYPTT